MDQRQMFQTVETVRDSIESKSWTDLLRELECRQWKRRESSLMTFEYQNNLFISDTWAHLWIWTHHLGNYGNSRFSGFIFLLKFVQWNALHHNMSSLKNNWAFEGAPRFGIGLREISSLSSPFLQFLKPLEWELRRCIQIFSYSFYIEETWCPVNVDSQIPPILGMILRTEWS